MCLSLLGFHTSYTRSFLETPYHMEEGDDLVHIQMAKDACQGLKVTGHMWDPNQAHAYAWHNPRWACT